MLFRSLLVQPKVLERCILNQFSRILLEEDDDHTDDDDDGGGGGADDDDDDVDDNDPVELFQKRGKWWELIVNIPYMEYMGCAVPLWG